MNTCIARPSAARRLLAVVVGFADGNAGRNDGFYAA